jgi:hypothetical protein
VKAALGLALVSALAAGSAGCRGQPSPTIFIDPALAVLVPPDTTMLAGIRMQRVQATPFYDSVESAPRVRDFRSRIGLAKESDIWEYLIASNGSRWIALLRGKFTAMGLEPRVDKPGARRESYNGVPVIGDDKGAIAFLNPTTAIAGPFESVLRALELRNNNSGIPEELRKLTEQIPANNEAWFVSTGPVPAFLPAANLRLGRGGFDPRKRDIDILIEAESESAAKSFAEALNGRAERTRVTAKGPAPAHVIDWMLGKSSVPAGR